MVLHIIIKKLIILHVTGLLRCGVLGLQVNLMENSQVSFNILLFLIKSKALLNVFVRCLQRLGFCVPIA